MEPLQVDRLGTLADPIMVFSLVSFPYSSNLLERDFRRGVHRSGWGSQEERFVREIG
jgi:hypothetical protein